MDVLGPDFNMQKESVHKAEKLMYLGDSNSSWWEENWASLEYINQQSVLDWLCFRENPNSG